MEMLIHQTRDTAQRPRYRVWHAFNVPHNMEYYAVASPEEAKTLIAELTEDDLKSTFVKSNAFGLEELEADGYHEWYDEEGHSITDLMDEEEDN